MTARFWKFWQKPGVGPVRTYRWEDVRARSYKLTEFTGSAGRESYLLALLWGEESDPRQCKEIITIGYKGWWEDELLWRLYEHIRRYMEEDGPPIQPGETLRTSGFGKLPAFPPEVIAKAGGPALSPEEVMKLADQAAT
ncbi:hypothetical protein CSC70_00175 [Pseudoxanthomonas kalamensis DSM 18571]|nr:hypothetical protein CSC70_00175 [Pseudoxanthomonas kalamensis DSM 18571]